MSNFKVGQQVVHISHGTGTIIGIEKREFTPGKQTKFYILEVIDDGAPKKVFVPFESDSRLRNVINKNQVDNIYKILDNKKIIIDHQTWNRRYREYMEKIHTGQINEIAEVLNSLYQLKHDKDLSFGERKLLDQAKSLIVKELSIVENKTEEEIENKIEYLLTHTKGFTL